MNVKVINKSNFELPSYQTPLSAGLDLRANITDAIQMKSLERVLVPTGLYIELPAGFEAQIRPRSGLAFKNGITVLNSPGTIDADYRGEIKVLLVNLSTEIFEIKSGERIAQMVISKHENITWQLTDELSSTERGQGGYGSTGTK